MVILLGLACSCAGPSRGEIAERNAEVQRMSQAKAVHMPVGVDSCVGVTLRLTDPSASAETVAEREKMASLLSASEIAAATKAAGVEACSAGYLAAVNEGAAAPEPLELAMTYGINPDGKVCAVIEKDRMEPIDPGAITYIEKSADCLKNTLFASQFPAGRVKDLERIVLTYKLIANPVEEVRATPPKVE